MARLPLIFSMACERIFKGGKDLLLNRGVRFKYDEEYSYCTVDRMIYIRDSYRKPIGVIIVNKGYCGWSLCHKNDEWDKLLGIYKAICKLGSKKTLKQVKESLDKRIDKKLSNNDKDYNIKMGCLFVTLEYIENKIKEFENGKQKK